MIDRREFLLSSTAAVLALKARAGFAGAAPGGLSTRVIPGTKEVLPVIGLGNSPSFRADNLAVARTLIDIFLEHGGRYVDVGGSSRFNVGRIAREAGASERLFTGNYLEPADLQTMRAEAARVAEAQGKDALDLVHTRNIAGYREFHDNYLALKEEGLVRYVGVARSGADNFGAIGGLVEDDLVDFIQVNYSLVEPSAGDDLLPLAKARGIAVCINRPFINGDYFSIVSGHELPGWVADFDCDSWAQFSLKFILANRAVNCVLTETSNPQHAVDNLGAGTGRLPDDDARQRMLALIRELL